MRLRHFTMLFAILLFAVLSLMNGRQRLRERVARESWCYDRCIDFAVDMAAQHMAVYSDGCLTVDCELAVEAFFNNLAAGLGVLDQRAVRERLYFMVPFIVITDEEGYYLWHFADEQRLEHVWDAKVYFAKEEGKTRAEMLEAVLREYSGATVEFFLPEADENFWLRGTEQPGIFVYLQGLPLSAAGKTYQRIAFAGAQISKKALTYSVLP